MKAARFLTPKSIFYGEGVLDQALKEIVSYGNKPLIVTGNSAVRLGYVKRVMEFLRDYNIFPVLYNDVTSEPDDKHVEKGLQIYENNNCDFLIAIGGGSPIDAAKAIGIMVANPGKISDYMGLDKVENNIPAVIAIPTTSGTGSEVTRYTIINDTSRDVKMLIASFYIMPEMAIVDPELTISVPASVTAATGLDALTHAIEGYTSVKNQPLTDNLALSAIRKISRYLKRAYLDGNDMEARSQLMLASTEAGLVINNSSVTLVHGMSRPIGALFHIPHGISNAVLLGDCMKFACTGNQKRFAELARAMANNRIDGSAPELAIKGVMLIRSLCNDVGIPNLLELGIEKNDYLANLEKMAEDALASGSPGNTYRSPDKEDIISIYKKLLDS
ncbi:iron-containing alcohol dehydrogenase [Halocella sp. SP3-1]|uniref:iron-containing alcohol dehydrogenase n=1 Tax=Halocella sp. SP3-1 TaxID=2382161 RepID=UPI000F76125F|nr:iron-containing alcohol dehydrogenase [Halocella sp. SP3-1]AZO94849.1 iron-containing alcohol dehydrogenase [Halocella sp. SP3-1]